MKNHSSDIVSILKAADRKAVSTVVAVHVSKATAEVQVSGVGTIYRTWPIAAEATHTAERATAADAEAGQGQFKRRGKSSGCIVATPTCTLSIPLSFSW